MKEKKRKQNIWLTGRRRGEERRGMYIYMRVPRNLSLGFHSHRTLDRQLGRSRSSCRPCEAARGNTLVNARLVGCCVRERAMACSSRLWGEITDSQAWFVDWLVPWGVWDPLSAYLLLSLDGCRFLNLQDKMNHLFSKGGLAFRWVGLLRKPTKRKS